MPTPVSQRVKKRRDALRAAGLRPVQIWVPDTRSPEFQAELSRQIRRINEADAKDAELQQFMDAALAETFAELDRLEAEQEGSDEKSK